VRPLLQEKNGKDEEKNRLRRGNNGCVDAIGFGKGQKEKRNIYGYRKKGPKTNFEQLFLGDGIILK